MKGFSTIGTPSDAARWRRPGEGRLVMRIAGSGSLRSRNFGMTARPPYLAYIVDNQTTRRRQLAIGKKLISVRKHSYFKALDLQEKLKRIRYRWIVIKDENDMVRLCEGGA
jgi:hypothetical protein